MRWSLIVMRLVFWLLICVIPARLLNACVLRLLLIVEDGPSLWPLQNPSSSAIITVSKSQDLVGWWWMMLPYEISAVRTAWCTSEMSEIRLYRLQINRMGDCCVYCLMCCIDRCMWCSINACLAFWSKCFGTSGILARPNFILLDSPTDHPVVFLRGILGPALDMTLTVASYDFPQVPMEHLTNASK